MMHQIVGQDVGELDLRWIFQWKLIFWLATYFEENPRLKPFLQRLHDANKQIFIITNSAYWYVNHGMSYLLGED